MNNRVLGIIISIIISITIGVYFGIESLDVTIGILFPIFIVMFLMPICAKIGASIDKKYNSIKTNKNKKSIIILATVLIICSAIIIIKYRNQTTLENANNINNIDNIETENNDLNNHYWISDTDYGYENGKLTIYNSNVLAFQLLKKNKCNIATINGDTYYSDGRMYQISKGYDNNILNHIKKSGIWFSNIESCTYKIKNHYIYITPSNNNTYTVLNGDYLKSKDNIEIIWNGNQQKTIYNEIEIKENIEFYSDYTLSYKDTYLYDMINYNIGEHIRNGSFRAGMDYKEFANNIIQEHNLGVDAYTFISFNEAYYSLDTSSLENRILFSTPNIITYNRYSNNKYSYKVILNENEFDTYVKNYDLMNKSFNLYAPKRKLTNDEIIKRVSEKFYIPIENVVPYKAEELNYSRSVKIYYTSDSLKKILG